MSSPGSDAVAAQNYFEEVNASRRLSVKLPDMLSGDEGDDERRARFIKIHDFEPRNGSVSISTDGHSMKRSKKNKKHKSKRHHRTTKSEETNPVPELTEAPAAIEHPAFANVLGPQISIHDGAATRMGNEDSRRSGIKNFARPTLPKLLSQNVFVGTPPVSSVAMSNLAKSRSGPPPLRRASSLPDRLNERANTTPGNRQLPMGREMMGSTLPPYANRGAWAARLTEPHVVNATDDEEPEEKAMSRTAAVVMLLLATALVAVCAEFLVDAIPEMTEHSAVSQAFIGLIILPIVGNAAEHVTAVTVAAKNKMDLAIGIAVGSSIQIALFITPVVVILGWCMNKEMTLYFNLFETVSLFVTAFVVNFLVLDGKSNYLEGVLLIAAYIIIA
jgi:Ca2+:H+ antiporter